MAAVKRLWRWLAPRLEAFWIWTGLLADEETSARLAAADAELEHEEWGSPFDEGSKR